MKIGFKLLCEKKFGNCAKMFDQSESNIPESRATNLHPMRK